MVSLTYRVHVLTRVTFSSHLTSVSVYKWNHDQDYIDRVTEDLTDEDLANERRNVDGKIKHVYLEKFEELENGDTLESILNEYGRKCAIRYRFECPT